MQFVWRHIRKIHIAEVCINTHIILAFIKDPNILSKCIILMHRAIAGGNRNLIGKVKNFTQYGFDVAAGLRFLSVLFLLLNQPP